MDTFYPKLPIGPLKAPESVGPNLGRYNIRPASRLSCNWVSQGPETFHPVNGPSPEWANNGPIYITARCRPVISSPQLGLNLVLNLLKAYLIFGPN